MLEAALSVARSVGGVDPSAPHPSLALLVWLGQFGEARHALDVVLENAELDDSSGAALALLARIDAAEGLLERAIQRWDEAASRSRDASPSIAASALLDAATALLDRDSAADVSAAAARLATARALVAGMTLRHAVASDAGLAQSITNASVLLDGAPEDRPLRIRLRLLLDRTRGASDPEAGLHALEALMPRFADRALADLAWQAQLARAQLHAHRGGRAEATRAREAAVEMLEGIAFALPRELRDGFWADPRRAAARPSQSRTPTTTTRSEFESALESAHAPDRRWVRLLELTKRLASERDVDRLLAQITASAVELSGAERGSVLLVDDDGQLAPHTVEDATSPDSDHVVFSRSIAEAVLIDREPIVTVDARTDGRLREYVSVHQLSLQSVACLPIADADAIRGVLYVEHRVRRGRFSSRDVELLMALADQAAIALTNARARRELEEQTTRLVAANEALERAQADIVRLLESRTTELADARTELERARDAMRRHERHGIVGSSDAIRKVLAIVERVADTSVPVVIHGESGTGKELVARAIHAASSRAKRPFVALNCAAVAETLLESELFGHKKGAFTGADRDRPGVFVQASGGTLFLDEIGDMPAKMQVELLRVLQDGKVRAIGGDDEVSVDVRIVCASNKLLSDLVARGAFREDLFYRLNVVEVRLPPLRERRGDLALLADHFLRTFAERDGGLRKRLSRAALRALQEHALPGNVRQLEHVLLNAVVMTDREVLEPRDLLLLGLEPSEVSDDESLSDEVDPNEEAESSVGEDQTGPPPSNEAEWKAHEKKQILAALEAASWNRVRAAKQLGMPRRTFYRRLKEYGILD